MSTYHHGPDLSHWNTPMSAYGTKALTLEGDFCMIKATQGLSYIDPTFKDRLKVLSGQHHYGAYHYLSRKDGKVLDQVKYYINTLEVLGVINESVLCLDWEEGLTKGTALEIEDACKWVADRTGRVPMIYVSYSNINLVPELLPVWAARWRDVDAISYNLYSMMRNLHPNIVMWQWTNKKESKYFTSKIDYNVTHLDLKAWQKIGTMV